MRFWRTPQSSPLARRYPGAPILVLLLACHAEPQVVGDDPVGNDGPLDAPAATPGETTESVTGEEPPDPTCGDLYDPDLLPVFSIEIGDGEWEAIELDYSRGEKNYHPIRFTYEDEVVEDAQIRLKGNPDFSWFSEKKQFVISFNAVDPDARFHGIRKLSLDASWYEPTLLRDRLSWTIMRDHPGVPSGCSNNALLYINGEYYGLYGNIEYFDHEWLERSFGDQSTGGLWKYGTDAEANPEASTRNLERFWDARTVAEMEASGDVSEWLAEWSLEAVLGDDDGYWCCGHNFYLYDHPSQGILFVPWDFDDTFDITPYDSDPVDGYTAILFNQAHYRTLLGDPGWRSAYVDALEESNALLDAATLIPEIEAWDAQISADLEADPHRSIGWEEHEQTVQRLKEWIPQRHAFVKSWIACERGENTDADGDGATVCDDPDDDNPAIHPAASEICNGIDDDADGWIDDDPACEDCVRHDFEERNYLWCRWPRSWADAEANCEAHGGELMWIEDTADYYLSFFYTWPIFEPWWFGASDLAREGAWVGMDGEAVSVYWVGGEPDNAGEQDCAAYEVGDYAWGSEDCGDEHPSVCVVP